MGISFCLGYDSGARTEDQKNGKIDFYENIWKSGLIVYNIDYFQNIYTLHDSTNVIDKSYDIILIVEYHFIRQSEYEYIEY